MAIILEFSRTNSDRKSIGRGHMWSAEFLMAQAAGEELYNSTPILYSCKPWPVKHRPLRVAAQPQHLSSYLKNFSHWGNTDNKVADVVEPPRPLNKVHWWLVQGFALEVR
jgi:hypothetical protein